MDAALVGLDQIARQHRHVMFVATSNFPEAIDGALMSRADLVVNVELPDVTARRTILADVLEAVVTAFPNARALQSSSLLDQAARASDGLDGRQLRKIVAAAAGRSDASTTDPGKLTSEDLLAAIADAVKANTNRKGRR